MPLHMHRAVAVACALAPVLFAIPGTTLADEVFAPSAQVTIPGVPMGSWDISFVDPSLGQFFLGDRTHNQVDVVNTSNPPSLSPAIGNGDFAGVVPAATCQARPGGSGTPGPNDCNGPNGVLTTNHTELWASDGNSTVKVFDLTAPGNPLIATISTNGVFRGDEMCFDPEHQLVMVANNSQADHNSVLNSNGPFASIISVKSHAVVKQIAFNGTKGAPNSTNGAEQCSWSPKTEKFYITIPGVNNPDDGTGVVAVIDPEDLDDNVQKVFPLKNTDCDTPQGSAKGPGHQLLIGCNGSTHSTNSVVINDQSGQIMARVPNESGPDEVWFNPGDDQYFLGISGGLASTQLLGVIDARGLQADQSVFTANKPAPPASASHSVAADPVHNQVFVAIGGKGSSTVCGSVGGSDAQGCIAAYTAPHDDRCLVAEGAPVITASAGDDDATFMRGHCRR